MNNNELFLLWIAVVIALPSFWCFVYILALHADELGPGMRNTNKYTKMYSGGTPGFNEGDIFVTTIPLKNVADVKTGPKGDVAQKKNGK